MTRKNIGDYVRPGLCPCCGSGPPIWTPQTIVDAARAFYEEHGRPPGQTDWVTAHPGQPAAGTVYRIFQNFNDMLEAAGLPLVRVGRPRRWTKQMVIDAMLDWLARTGKWPSSYDWSRDVESDHPHYTTAINLFGTWADAKRAAGWAEGRTVAPPQPHNARGIAA